MILDLHSHYFPLEAVRGLESAPVTVGEVGEAIVELSVLGSSMPLERDLFDLERQRADRRRQRLDRRTLMVPPFTALYELPPDEGIQWSQLLNQGIAEAAAAYPEEFVGFATVPLQDGVAAAAELERGAALGLRGVEILSSVNGVGLDDPSLEPFWETAAWLAMPILIHPSYVAGTERLGPYYLRNLLGNPTETANAGARLIFGGVLERHPTLKVILAHGGGSLPQIIGRLQHGAEVRAECRHARSPREQLGNLYFDTIVFDPLILRHLVELAGAERVVLGTDYPFDMGETRPLEFVAGAGLADADVETILHAGERLLNGVA